MSIYQRASTAGPVYRPGMIEETEEERRKRERYFTAQQTVTLPAPVEDSSPTLSPEEKSALSSSPSVTPPLPLSDYQRMNPPTPPPPARARVQDGPPPVAAPQPATPPQGAPPTITPSQPNAPPSPAPGEMPVYRPAASREPWDERLPDGTPAMQLGIPNGQNANLMTGSQGAAAQPRPVNNPSVPAVSGPVYKPGAVDAQIKPTASLDELFKLGDDVMAQPEKVAQAANLSFDHVDEILNHLYELEKTPAKDKNGRFKSFLIGLLNGIGESARQQIASGNMSLGAVLGGGIGGGLHGAIRPSWDEQLARHATIERERGRLENALKIDSIRATIAQHRAQAGKAAQAPAKLDQKARAARFAELSKRIKIMGGTYQRGKDAQADAIVDELGVAPAPPKRGGLNPGRLKNDHGKLVYVDFDEDGQMIEIPLAMEGGQPIPLNPEDRLNLAIQLERMNQDRARNGLPPLMPADDLLSAPGGAAATPGAQPATGPVYNPQPQPGTSPAPSAAPQPATQSPLGSGAARPPLVPTGEPAPTLPIYHRGGRRRSSGGRGGSSRSPASATSSGGSVYDNAAAQKIIDDVEQANQEYKSAMRRGQDDAAQAALERANGLADSARNNPNLRNTLEVGGAPDHKGRNVPYVKFKPKRSHASANRIEPRQFRSAIRGIMDDYDVDAQTARGWLVDSGYSPAQR